ncbi:MAG: monovalent cation/H(+) antiporter subunit G [Phycisphaerae bacterium]
MLHSILIVTLLGAAVVLCFLCSLGVLVMRDPLQRLQYSSPITTIAITLITVAVFIDDEQLSSRLKAVLIALILFMMNAALTHATARAVRIRKLGQWPPKSDEKIPVFKDGKLHANAAEANH